MLILDPFRVTIGWAIMPERSNCESVIVGLHVKCGNQNNLCRVYVGGVRMARRKERVTVTDQTLVLLSKERVRKAVIHGWIITRHEIKTARLLFLGHYWNFENSEYHYYHYRSISQSVIDWLVLLTPYITQHSIMEKREKKKQLHASILKCKIISFF